MHTHTQIQINFEHIFLILKFQNRHLQEATAMNPDMTVEKIEIQQQTQ